MTLNENRGRDIVVSGVGENSSQILYCEMCEVNEINKIRCEIVNLFNRLLLLFFHTINTSKCMNKL